MLAAISNGKCKLSGVLFSDDSRAFLDCLDKLGFKLEIDENAKTIQEKLQETFINYLIEKVNK